MAFYRFISIYMPNRPKARVEIGVGAEDAAGIRVKVPLFLMKAHLANLSLSTRGKL